MGLRDLLRRVPAAARAAAEGHTLRERVAGALAVPPDPNRYVAPGLRRLEAVAFALRGYRVWWTQPKVQVAGGRPYPSVLVYGCHAGPAAVVLPDEDEEASEPFDWCVEVPTLLPGEAHRAASWLEGARAIGLRFALMQVRRELPWVRQARARQRGGR